MQNQTTIPRILEEIRSATGKCFTSGLSDKVIVRFLTTDPQLEQVIKKANIEFRKLQSEFTEELKLPEEELIQRLQDGFLNFYPPESTSPFIPIAGKGPWVVTCYGAVIYDVGGYGMLGFGHSRQVAKEILSKHAVMANIMTPHFSQYRFVNILRKKIGFTRPKNCQPYRKFLTMNSGSEALSVAARISDVKAKIMTDPGGKHQGKRIIFVSLKQSFHGRTDRPAQVSSSTRKYYQNLASFRNLNNLRTVEPNNIAELNQVFADIEREKLYVEAVFLEPVMGEGCPGLAITPEFYAAARKLTRTHGSLLIVDSVQAGLRATGCLSITDYPGFEETEPPDMEAFSKALNAGQFPLSALAITEQTAKFYRKGIYGNTMTGNPRGLDLARAVLQEVTEDVVLNIRARGKEFLEKLEQLKAQTGKAILKVQGTGLLLSAELNPEQYNVTSAQGVERYMRLRGVNIIHGGENALRFTPYFRITSAEIGLLVDVVRDALENCRRS